MLRTAPWSSMRTRSRCLSQGIVGNASAFPGDAEVRRKDFTAWRGQRIVRAHRV